MVKVGEMVEFLGYTEAVSPEEDVLVVGEHYKVSEVDAKTKSYVLEMANPDYDPDLDESEDNSVLVYTDAYENEVKPVPAKAASRGKAAAAAPKGKAAAKEPAGKPAKVTDIRPADADAEVKPVKPVKPAKPGKPASKSAVKGKAAAKAKPAKAKAKAKQEVVEPEDKYGALEAEDTEIAELVEQADNILDLAQELAETSASSDWKLGGVLYHVRLSKAYEELDERYSHKGGIGVKSGFELYLNEVLNLEYRKAMHLIEIYHHFSQFGIDGAKLAEIGWTKASKIVRVMDEDNAADLLELAETSSVAELTESIKETYVEEGGTKGEKKRKIAFKFRLWNDQAKAVEEVLLATMEAMGFKEVSDTFEHIVMEWAAEHPLSAPAKGKAVSPSKGKATGTAAAAAPKGRAAGAARANA